ncbi:Ribosomal protein S15A [Carpediemonas membranifera]|nr:Ribosomal protein S15A [Carpediemonas membranifera]|eukprot:KAG9396612.1 Ribosomal protein S15A [Carpediemonas membranifera]
MCRPASKVSVHFLGLMQKHGYIGDFTVIDDHRAGKICVNLIGRLNKTRVISPRYDVAHEDIEQWVQRLLPSRLFGHIVLSTSKGIMTHHEAAEKGIGGKVIGYFF